VELVAVQLDRDEARVDEQREVDADHPPSQVHLALSEQRPGAPVGDVLPVRLGGADRRGIVERRAQERTRVVVGMQHRQREDDLDGRLAHREVRQEERPLRGQPPLDERGGLLGSDDGRTNGLDRQRRWK
jgi:hypothetical protein